MIKKIIGIVTIWGFSIHIAVAQNVESVVFECDGSLEQKSVLVARMTAFLISRHFNVDQDDNAGFVKARTGSIGGSG